MLVAATIQLTSCSAEADPVRELGYSLVWQKARQTCVPDYPVESILRGKQGVAVVDMQLSPEGEPTRLQVLESPDEATGRVLRVCASKWRIHPGVSSTHGKLYAYFVLSHGRGKVFVINDSAQKKELLALNATAGTLKVE
jgi:TonB family protein